MVAYTLCKYVRFKKKKKLLKNEEERTINNFPIIPYFNFLGKVFLGQLSCSFRLKKDRSSLILGRIFIIFKLIGLFPNIKSKFC